MKRRWYTVPVVVQVSHDKDGKPITNSRGERLTVDMHVAETLCEELPEKGS